MNTAFFSTQLHCKDENVGDILLYVGLVAAWRPYEWTSEHIPSQNISSQDRSFHHSSPYLSIPVIIYDPNFQIIILYDSSFYIIFSNSNVISFPIKLELKTLVLRYYVESPKKGL